MLDLAKPSAKAIGTPFSSKRFSSTATSATGESAITPWNRAWERSWAKLLRATSWSAPVRRTPGTWSTITLLMTSAPRASRLTAGKLSVSSAALPEKNRPSICTSAAVTVTAAVAVSGASMTASVERSGTTSRWAPGMPSCGPASRSDLAIVTASA